MKTKKMLITAIATIAFIASTQAQNVNIPDTNFKAALVNNSSINTNMDAEIQVSEASVFNGYINVSGLGISDLTGIEAFVLLDSLDCSYNQLAALNVSACSVLTTLDCSYNYPISSLDVSANSLLTYLDCSAGYTHGGSGFIGQLTSLDLSSNAALTYLNCNWNQLASLDFPSSSILDYLDCGRNNFTSLNISSCTALTTLKCYANLLAGINLSSNTALVYLDCNNNQLISLNVSANTSLANLNCSYNHPMTSLDVSANTLLTYLDCSGCVVWDSGSWSESQLAYLNVKNGNNINMSDHSFFALCNPNLTCIEVDNASWSTTNWAGYSYLVEIFWPGVKGGSYFEQYFQSNIDAQSFYSENCSGVGITDNNESTSPMYYPNPTSDIIYLSEPANISLSDFSGKLLLEQKNTNQLDISSLPAGMYFLSFGENNKHTFKVIKE